MRVSQNPQCRVVVDRLAMAIALIALKSSNTCWGSSVSDIITFGSANAHQCYLGLILLKHVSLQSEEHMFDRKTKHVIDEFLRESLPVVLGFLTQILESA